MQPSQFEFATFYLRTVALPSLKTEHPVTRCVIEAIPRDRGDYRPDPASRTALDLAWHIAWAENVFLDGVAAGEFPFANFTRPDAMRDPASIAAWYSETFEKNCDRVSKLEGEQLVKILDYRGAMQQPAVVYLHAALVHSVHHRGQLSTYMRPMGARVPSIYGESFDAAEARRLREGR